MLGGCSTNMVNLFTHTVTLPMYLQFSGMAHKNSHPDELDEFWMYTYKVRRCARTRSHDWTECPYAHRGEKARRRDPRKFPYHGIACPEFRQTGECPRGQNCEYAHGVFEFWLHPTRYRTRVCEAGLMCPRRICFFAHTPEQLRPEAVRDCFRCELRGHAVREAAAAGGRVEAAAVAACCSSSTLKKGGKEGVMVRCGETGDEEYFDDLPDIGWVVDLVK